MVSEEGLEPSQGFLQLILSPTPLPFHYSGTKIYQPLFLSTSSSPTQMDASGQ